MSDQVENRKVEWRKIRSCIRSQFDEPMKDERKKEKEKQGEPKTFSIVHFHPTR